ncbi:693_t:CDS:2 [Funneliformis caledonium]|uniref:DNA 3'-5' helicase n=1 Tax=Funneliformis caledonium TaxID=1117310 RepID=A0A9N9BGI3_9GLOM|nr:693_t:CDS:2 [Funneliformis caledonium]
MKKEGKKLKNRKKQTEMFDFDQDLVSYRKNVKLNIETQEFIPSFSHLIHDFTSLLKCHACLSFPKYSSISLCKIPNTEIFIEKKIDMVINQVFEFSGYREKQYESIISFINEKNTLALIDDQIRELINIGIPCAGLYTSTNHPSNYQEKYLARLQLIFYKCMEIFGYIKAIVSLIMLTATCLPNETWKIQSIMNIKVGDLNIVRSSSFIRSEMTFEVQTKSSMERTINEICEQIQRIGNEYCIIYCASPASCEEVLKLIRNKLESISLDIYHGKLESSVRHQSITHWKRGLTQVMIATNTFGLGINMLIFLYSGNLIQEAGMMR